MSARLAHLLSITHQSIKTFNLFATTTTDERAIRQQQIYTRVYLVLYLSSLSVLLFYTAIVERSISKTYLLHSMTDYEQLVNLYSYDIDCPCTYISIPYSDFIIELRANAYHEACTTNTIEFILTYGNIMICLTLLWKNIVNYW